MASTSGKTNPSRSTPSGDHRERDDGAAPAPGLSPLENARRCQWMLEHGPQPFASTDLDRRILYVNDAFCKLVGYSHDELIGSSILDLTAPESLEETRRSHERALAESGAESIIKQYRHKDGRLIPVELLLEAARDDHGQAIGLFGFVTDVSQRMRAKEALVESERWVRAIFEGIHDAVLVQNQDGTILDANPAAARLLGYDLSELIGMSAERIDEGSDLRDWLKRQPLEGRTSRETTFRTKRGESIPVEITSSNIQFDSRKAVLATVRDISERIALERTRRRFAEVQMKSAQTLEAKNRALSQSEERYRRLTEGSLDAIVVTDGGGRIILFNPAAEAVFGREAREVIGATLDLLIPSLFQQPQQQVEVRAQSMGADGSQGGDACVLPINVASILNRTVELNGRRRDGSEFPIELSFGSVEANGRIEYVASIRDQTERQRMRAMLAHTDKLASIGLLSAGVAHEINNPLSYVGNNLAVLQRDVKGLLEMLIEAENVSKAQPDKFQKFEEISEEIDWPYIRANLEPMIDRTLEGVRRVANIVQKLRGLARTSRPKWEKVGFDELLENALEMMRGRLRRDGIELIVQNEGVPFVQCVPNDVTQVLLNLLINALQAIEAANPDGGGRLEIRARNNDPWVEISISDNGEGIAADDLVRLFDPFFTTKPVGEGTGLGLAISHGIITGHGGRIEVESRLQEGTTFRILLPRLQPEEARPAPPTA